MGRTFKFRGRYINVYFGFSGTKRFAWAWKLSSTFQDTTIYRCQPISIMIWPA
jgi:hypothetical protein